jgi:hypothetical protein
MQKIQGLVEVPKIVKSSIIEEETGGRRSRGSGARTLRGLLRANKYLHEVTKSDFNLDHWIWKGTW